MTDPAIWGPLIVAAAVLYSGYAIEHEIRESARQRDVQHREATDILIALSVDIERVEAHLSSIEINTQPSSEHREYGVK